jgi:hypothetical protein
LNQTLQETIANVEGSITSLINSLDDIYAKKNGDYATLRARATTKADVGLSLVPNWGADTFDSRYLRKDEDGVINEDIQLARGSELAIGIAPGGSPDSRLTHNGSNLTLENNQGQFIVESPMVVEGLRLDALPQSRDNDQFFLTGGSDGQVHLNTAEGIKNSLDIPDMTELNTRYLSRTQPDVYSGSGITFNTGSPLYWGTNKQGATSLFGQDLVTENKAGSIHFQLNSPSKSFVVEGQNSQGQSRTILDGEGGASCRLYFDGGEKLQTVNQGVRVTGTAQFTSMPLNYLPEAQGTYVGWNRVGGGLVDFLCHRGLGAGGFRFWNGDTQSQALLGTLSSSGVLNVLSGFSVNGQNLDERYIQLDSGRLPDERFSGDYTGIDSLRFTNETREKVVLYGSPTVSTNYALGVESGALFFKSNGSYHWYIGQTTDGGISSRMTLSGSGLNLSGNIEINNAAPTIRFKDETVGSDDFFLHSNSNIFYVLSDRDDDGSHESPHPLALLNSNSSGLLYGQAILTASNYSSTLDDRYYTKQTSDSLYVRKNDPGSNHNHDSLYAPILHRHDWSNLNNIPVYATRWPTYSEVSEKPSSYPTDWNNISGKPNNYPTDWNNISGKPSSYPTDWNNVSGKPTDFGLSEAEVIQLVEDEIAKKSLATASITVGSQGEYYDTVAVDNTGTDSPGFYTYHYTYLTLTVNCSDPGLSWVPLYWFTLNGTTPPYAFSTRFPVVLFEPTQPLLWDSQGVRDFRSFPASLEQPNRVIRGETSYLYEQNKSAAGFTTGPLIVHTNLSEMNLEDPENPGQTILNAIPVFQGSGTITLFCRTQVDKPALESYFHDQPINLGIFKCPDLATRHSGDFELLLDSVGVGNAKWSY